MGDKVNLKKAEYPPAGFWAAFGLGCMFVGFLISLPQSTDSATPVMAAVMFIGGAFFLYLAFCLAVANMGARRGRSWAAFFWISMLASPLIMWIIAASLSPLPGSEKYISPVFPETVTSKTSESNNATKIKQLAELRDSKLISDEEFEIKKAELLRDF